MKTLLKILLFVVLLALPFGVRYWLYYGLPTDSYQSPAMVTPDVTALNASPLTYQSYADQPKMGTGRVLLDLAHANNLLVDDLTPLKERLSARGVSVSVYDYDSYSLSEELRSATAFVVIAPARPFYLEEVRAVEDFVAQGGLLLLAADPTRSVPTYDEYGYVDLYALFFPESAVPAVNSLANRFGMQFFDDYLYNLKDYQINYRNVKITNFANNPLTAGLDEMILFAAHSVQSDGLALLTSGEDTRSNVRTGESTLAAAALSADGRVLALGDLTILTAPSHRAADNDRFLSNLADWLAQDARTWRLQDFPYLFTQPVDLVAVTEDALDPAVLNLVGPVQGAFVQAGMEFSWSQSPGAGHDLILAGLFEETMPISDVLASAGISVTLVTEPDESAELAEATEPADDEDDDVSVTSDKPTVSTVRVDGMGEFELEGLQLFVVTRDGVKTSLIILASGREALSSAVQRLLYRDFSGCSTQAEITLCASDAYAVWDEPLPSDSELPTPPSTDGGSAKVLILAVDTAAGPGRTSVEEWLSALTGIYDVTVWSVLVDGIPDAEDLAGYDAYIIDTGDYAYDAVAMSDIPIYLIEGNWLLIGEQPDDPESYDLAPLADLAVSQPDHPLVTGFPLGEDIVLAESESGVPALVLPEADGTTDDVQVILARGATSDLTGTPVMMAYEFPDIGSRFGLASFAFYRLPEELRTTFAINLVEWLLNR